MKNIIFYKSNTGFTKQYVDMLQNRIVPLEVYKVEKINKKLLEGADNVFFAGPLRNNVILGLSKFLKKYKYGVGVFKNTLRVCVTLRLIIPLSHSLDLG